MAAYTKFSNARLLNTFLYCLALILFFGAAYRTGGPDLLNYREFYYNSPERIPDLFFSQMFLLFNYIGLKFEYVLLLMMSVTLVSIKKITKAFEVSFLFTFCIYFAYLIPIRDLGQIRIALAISLLIIAFSVNRKKHFSWPLYLAAALCHYTTIVLILNIFGSYIIASFNQKVIRSVLLILSIVIIFYIGQKIEELAFFDPRLSLYLSYTGHVDGRPVQSLMVIIYYILITFSFMFLARDELSERDKRSLTYMMIFSIAIFFSLYNVAILAFRLAHVAAALHPVMIAIIFKSVRKDRRLGTRKIFGILVITVLMLIYIQKISVNSPVYDLKF